MVRQQAEGQCFQCFKEHFATRLAVMYNFLWPIFVPDSIGNVIKTVSLYSTVI